MSEPEGGEFVYLNPPFVRNQSSSAAAAAYGVRAPRVTAAAVRATADNTLRGRPNGDTVTPGATSRNSGTSTRGPPPPNFIKAVP